MGFKTALQSFLLISCAGCGGAALSLRSTIRDIEPLPVEAAYELRDASTLTALAPRNQPTHRRVYAYRLDGLMPSRRATDQVHSSGASPLQQRGAPASDDTDGSLHPAHSLGSLYALHAIESAFPFRWLWVWHTFSDTLRISNTVNVWWRTRPSWMARMAAELAEAPDGAAQERLVKAAVDAVETMSDVRLEALVDSGDCHGAVIRGGQRTVTVTCPPSHSGEAPQTLTTEMVNVSPLYAVRFALPAVSAGDEKAPSHPRSAPLYVLYISAPYSSDNPTSAWEQVRMWTDAWYSRWFAAHVVKALAEM